MVGEILRSLRSLRMTLWAPAFSHPLPLEGEGEGKGGFPPPSPGEGEEDLFPFADENTSLIYANEIKDQVLCPNLQTILTIGFTI